MDLGRECSALESVEDNELPTTTTATTTDSVSNIDDHDDNNKKVTPKVNGLLPNEIQNVVTVGDVDGNNNSLPHDGPVKGGVEIEQVGNSVNSQPLTAKSPLVGSPASATTKGYGLKKWRRIKRDVVKDTSVNADINKALKRGLSTSGNSTKPTHLAPVEVKQNSQGSVGSVNVVRNVDFAYGFVTRGSSLESRFAVGSAFAAGTDSENSEDRSSKSSTAASAPRVKNDLPALLGHAREKNRTKNLSGKSVGSSAQRVQQGKGQVESSKKPRGERVKIEKENSHSSMESDSRSSNFIFVQGVHSVTSNGKQSGRSMNSDGENSDEGHADEQQFSEEVQAGYGQENVAEGKTENHWPSTDRDPLVESILTLQSLQEALESEVQKLGEIGKVGNVPTDFISTDPAILESCSSDQTDSENIRQSSLLESQVLSLTESVKYLESKLEEMNTMLKVKESMVAELEASLTTGKSPAEESGNTIELQQEKSREIETEIDSLFKQKIEAEVEYLALTRTIQKLRVAAGDHITLIGEQETLAVEQAQMLKKLGEAENKAAMLNKQAEELEKYCGDVLGTEEVLKMQRKVFKVTSCFFIQLILLILAFWLLVLQFLPRSGVVVPT